MVALFYLKITHNYHFVAKTDCFATKRKENGLPACINVYTLSFLPILLVQSCKFMHHFSKNRRTFAVVILQDDTETKYSH